jgi:hypothetical protein
MVKNYEFILDSFSHSLKSFDCNLQIYSSQKVIQKIYT